MTTATKPSKLPIDSLEHIVHHQDIANFLILLQVHYDMTAEEADQYVHNCREYYYDHCV